MSKTDEIMEQVDIYTDLVCDTASSNCGHLVSHAEAKLRAMIEDAMKVLVEVGTITSLQARTQLDCRTCARFVWRKDSCRCIYTCVNGSQYKQSDFIQIFRKE
jgi:hypothetical protein